LALSDAAALSPAAVTIAPIEGSGRWLIDSDGRLSADGLAARVDPVAGISCEVVQPVVEVDEVLVQAADPVVAAEVPVAGTGAPDPAAAPATPWTVERGETLWSISQEAYGVSDVSSTVALVGFVFDYNGNLLVDPNALDVGMTLQLPPLRF
jgi:LysM repeat protein